MSPASRTCSSARVRCSGCRARSSASFLRKHLLEGAHGHALVDAIAVEGVGADERFGLFARRAVDDDERAGAGSVRAVFQWAAEDDLAGIFFAKSNVS